MGDRSRPPRRSPGQAGFPPAARPGRGRRSRRRTARPWPSGSTSPLRSPAPNHVDRIGEKAKPYRRGTNRSAAAGA